MLYNDLTSALGYADAPLFCEDDGAGLVAPSDQHWLRAARAAGVRGSYLFRTSPTPHALRPAVHVAEAQTVDEAREIHRRLWNQGVNPFVIIVLPAEVRVFTGFAYHPDATRENRGEIIQAQGTFEEIRAALSAFTADAINRGDIWRTNARHLNSETRVDTTLLEQLRQLSRILESRYGIPARTCHSLIGKFVYLSYLRARGILSDKWLLDEAHVNPEEIFAGTAFLADVTLQCFRKVARAVEARFNGLLFPVPWGSLRSPRAEVIRTVARVFSGEDLLSGQLHLPFTAYDFSSIPVEFLSSIYEQFLHSEGPEDEEEAEDDVEESSNPEKRGAHYTPEPLADYLISEVEAIHPLFAGMRILDPCCGSGVFLVVAYRRLVEMECRLQGRTTLHATELRDLLQRSIFAVERNRTACQIAAFSLILTLLSYVDPPELHARRSFKFPSLIGSNLFCQDFFDKTKAFWRLQDQATGKAMAFDWIIGNPPWVELKANDPKAKHVLTWSKTRSTELGLARARTGEAFAWRVVDCLASNGAVGLILHAKTLTNDHLEEWRKKFFGGLQVHRVTNLANLAYVIFPSAQQPATTLIYSRKSDQIQPHAILHFGPFAANQVTINGKGATEHRLSRRRLWTIGYSESEVKSISSSEAATGAASVWKFALWGNPRDHQTIKRIRRALPTTLGELARSRGWNLTLGLQLRSGAGTREEPNSYIKDLEGLPVLDHRAFLNARRKGECSLTIPDRFLRPNTHGCYVRGNRTSGVAITKGPHLFLWTDFAAFSETSFIIRHSKVGLAGDTSVGLKAVAAVWNSSFIPYLLFFLMSSEWGISYSQIDKGDAEKLPFPELTSEREKNLATAWDIAVAYEVEGASPSAIKELLDQRVAEALGLHPSVSLVAREFFHVRYQTNKGKSPYLLREMPSEHELQGYADRLRSELDGFLGGRARHAITVLRSSRGISVSIQIRKSIAPIATQVRLAENAEATLLESLLNAAERHLCQWVYVKQSVRIFDGDTIHLIKPPRRIEWTETHALTDADDVIAEVIEARRETS
ncbi:hypothetical protein D7Y11_25410 [Corallococcus sp. AB018]|uniref:HsdM family class I SAM-dependent methyltransferase n=1 Tax=Corallococcus sp. AB018 TaxID=2316715 RepID=UPI000F883D2D|nr:DNA methyltransferase [Corallococcus sp. AB018]RUO90402.1 hypothetical protein D7Y11_25410 [Corallococcus sp. AB018]